MTFGGYPPGWYPDPWAPGGWRWWDGAQWTPAAQPPGSGPRVAVAELERWAGRVKVALPVGAVAYLANAWASMARLEALSGFFGSLFNPDVDDTADEFVGFMATAAVPSAAVHLASFLSSLAGMAILVVGVLFLVWFHQAATLAAGLGLPARFTPGWAVAGFLIPVANLWLPYQSAVDMVPPRDPLRRTVAMWWAAWVTMNLLPLSAFILMVWGPWLPGWALLLAQLAAIAAATMLAVRVVDGITGSLHGLVEARVGIDTP